MYNNIYFFTIFLDLRIFLIFFFLQTSAAKMFIEVVFKELAVQSRYAQ